VTVNDMNTCFISDITEHLPYPLGGTAVGHHLVRSCDLQGENVAAYNIERYLLEKHGHVLNNTILVIRG
jgi:hypothetical protein